MTTPPPRMSHDEFMQALTSLIVYWPLYQDFRIAKPNFQNSYILEFPPAVSMDCTVCVHRQPWDLNSGRAELGKDQGSGKSTYTFCELAYLCRACGNFTYYWVRVEAGSKGGSIAKTGQYPALELEPPPLVAAGMEKSDLALYRRALTSRHSNFGIGAVAYLRRIVEDRTNFLIDLIAKRQEEEDPTSPLLSRVEEVKRDRRFSEKIGFAADLLPKSVRLGGQNPISLLLVV